MAMSKSRRRPHVGDGVLVSEEDIPERVRAWPVYLVAIWVALAEGRRWGEAAAAATLAAERAGVVLPFGTPMTAGHVWRLVKDRRYVDDFKPLVDEQWKPLAEPAMGLLGKLVEEGMAEGASTEAKERGLTAAKEILKVVAPAPPKGDGSRVQVNVSGEGAHVAVVGLDDLLRAREPFRPRELSAGSVTVEAEATPAVEATQPRRSRTSSQRTGEQRARVREQSGRG